MAGGVKLNLPGNPPLPALHLMPAKPGVMRLWFWLPENNHLAKTYTKEVTFAEIPGLLEAWQASPEACLLEWFGYAGHKVEVKPAKSSSPGLSLADLGL